VPTVRYDRVLYSKIVCQLLPVHGEYVRIIIAREAHYSPCIPLNREPKVLSGIKGVATIIEIMQALVLNYKSRLFTFTPG
jgi:hypothetical protein